VLTDGFQHFKTAISTESYGNSGLVGAAGALAVRPDRNGTPI
jgi:hypothetical protein